MSGGRQYAMAVKYGSEPAPDWRERLAQIPGVTVTGSTGKRAQFTATPEAVPLVEEAFGVQFWIEETVERSPASE